MTYKEIKNLIKSIATQLNCDSTYNAFSDGKNRNEFIAWYYARNDDLFADDINYQEKIIIVIEYYTKNKSSSKEKIIQDNLNNNGFTYTKENSYIENEKIFLISYETEVIINA